MLGSCGSSGEDRADPTASDPAASDPVTPAPATTSSPPSTVPTTPTRIEEPATGTTPADRLDEAVHITWIGGSDLDLDGRTIPSKPATRCSANDP